MGLNTKLVGTSIVASFMVVSVGSSASLLASTSPSTRERDVSAMSPELAEIVRLADHVCPAEMAHVGSSCVDRYEGSLVEVHDDGTETDFSPYESPSGRNVHVRAVSRPGVVPQAHISMIEAARACRASGKRLCHGGEWKAACKGPNATRFPYGDARVANACVDTNRTSPMILLYQGERSGRTMNDARANQQENTLEPTGAAEACTNDYGVHDMVGNIHEWTDDGSFRGGYYLDTKLNGEGCDYRTTAHAPAYYDYSTGFRCCEDAGSTSDDN